jgi:hypothetical protein
VTCQCSRWFPGAFSPCGHSRATVILQLPTRFPNLFRSAQKLNRDSPDSNTIRRKARYARRIQRSIVKRIGSCLTRRADEARTLLFPPRRSKIRSLFGRFAHFGLLPRLYHPKGCYAPSETIGPYCHQTVQDVRKWTFHSEAFSFKWR